MAADRILVVDDDHSARWMLSEALKGWGYQYSEAQTVQSALFACDSDPPAAVLLDIDLPDGSGLKALREIKSRHPEIIVIMVTANVFFENAVEALRGGAFDFIGKPLNLNELEVTLRNGLETRRLRRRVKALGRQQAHHFSFEQLIGESPAMKNMLTLARKVAESNASAVLLQGESGTGKDLIASSIHYGSNRADGPFVALNCAAIPGTLIESELFGYEKGAFTDAKARKEGMFEQAEGGTIFFDEIGELELGLQAKLLRVFEQGAFRRVGGLKDIPYDARIIAASNRDLKAESRAGRFRADLFYRLSIIQIDLPTLRERDGDVLLLAANFIEQFNKRLGKRITGLSPEVTDLFLRYQWPGNVRELRNLIERLMILEESNVITTAWLPHELLEFTTAQPVQQVEQSAVTDQLQNAATASQVAGAHSITYNDNEIGLKFRLPAGGVDLNALEKSLLQQAIKHTKGNQTKAAALLGISRDQFRYRIKRVDAAEEER
ncbi:MAG: sigma-54-dependent Fis family transcriptional regulator [Acidobacteria bacterium]|nr:sigma-54-dependent Fis family transcriptional regulator [Acidobacteriota bacterium]MCW5969045.1 sigma-54-dependent Fis family transcriptional regulator [Blastocatellales bacterium]